MTYDLTRERISNIAEIVICHPPELLYGSSGQAAFLKATDDEVAAFKALAIAGLEGRGKVHYMCFGPLGFTEPERQRAQSSALYQRGDTIAVWANEGDLVHNGVEIFPPQEQPKPAAAPSPAKPNASGGFPIASPDLVEELATEALVHAEGIRINQRGLSNGTPELLYKLAATLRQLRDEKRHAIDVLKRNGNELGNDLIAVTAERDKLLERVKELEAEKPKPKPFILRPDERPR